MNYSISFSLKYCQNKKSDLLFNLLSISTTALLVFVHFRFFLLILWWILSCFCKINPRSQLRTNGCDREKEYNERLTAHRWNTNWVWEKNRLWVGKGGGWMRNAAEIELCEEQTPQVTHLCVCLCLAWRGRLKPCVFSEWDIWLWKADQWTECIWGNGV